MKNKTYILLFIVIVSSLLMTACDNKTVGEGDLELVDIHFPKEVVLTAFNSLDDEYIDEISKKEGVEEARLNDDGSFSLKITEKVQKEMMEGVEPSIEAAIKELEEIRLATKITHSDNYSKFEIVNPDGKEYFLKRAESAKIGLDWIGQRVVTYQGYARDEVGIEMTVKDEDGQLIGVYNYPEDFETQIKDRIEMLENKE